MVKGFKKKNGKGGHDFIPTDKNVIRDSTPDTEINIEVNTDSDEFAEGVRKDFASKNTDEHGITLDVIKELQELEKDKKISIKEVEDGFNTVSEVGKYLTLNNGATYNLFSSYDEMEGEAEARIREDLNEGGLFNTDFLASHIDMGNLKDMLHEDVYNMNLDRILDEAKNNPESITDELGLSVKEIKKLFKDNDYTQFEELAERLSDDELEDPIQYLEDIYGREDGIKKAMDIGGIDYDETIEDAIASDGVEHFISGYDGLAHETKDGQYLVKHND